MINDYLNRVSELEKQFLQKKGQRDLLNSNLVKLEQQEQETLISYDRYSKAKELLEYFVRTTEVRIREYIEPVVTEALDFIFNEPLYFHIVFVDRRGQIETDFIVLPNSEKEEEYKEYLNDLEKYEKEFDSLVKQYKDLNFLYGGAIREVLSLIIWLVLVELLQIKGTICLDEPSSSVHETYASRVGVFIKGLSERFNRQIIFVTHSQALAAAANKIYEVKKDKEISSVEVI